jgi:succinoglycan biosynthesis transport protein ExoP
VGNNSGKGSGSNGDTTALVPREDDAGIAFVRFSPSPPYDQRLVFWQQSASETAASFRLLRQRLIERGDPRSMLCTSAVRGEGATTVAANLAVAFAELGKYRVLLIEASFRRAALAEVFGFKPPKGFAAQLARHRAKPSEPWVVVQVGTAPLFVLAVEPRCCPHCAAVIAQEARFCGMCGKDVAGSPTASLDALTFSSAVKRFRSAFDYIVVDAPPVLAGGDVNLIQDTADAIVIATRRGKSEARELRRALNQVAPAPVAAVVLLDA